MSAKVALEDIKTNTKFARILELILLIGNYLNSGSRNAQSLGFDISFLSKVWDQILLYRVEVQLLFLCYWSHMHTLVQLKNTKTQDNKATLVHFLANVIEDKHPDLVQFQDDFTYLEKASKGITLK